MLLFKLTAPMGAPWGASWLQPGAVSSELVTTSAPKFTSLRDVPPRNTFVIRFAKRNRAGSRDTEVGMSSPRSLGLRSPFGSGLLPSVERSLIGSPPGLSPVAIAVFSNDPKLSALPDVMITSKLTVALVSPAKISVPINKFRSVVPLNPGLTVSVGLCRFLIPFTVAPANAIAKLS